MQPDQPHATGAGASARREHARRQAKDEARIREKWGEGRLGSFAVMMADERSSTKVWETGAVGEEVVGGVLDAIASDTVRVLHDRRVPGSRRNIDHLVVTVHGAWVIDSKRYKDKRPSADFEGGLFRPRVDKLLVGRSDRTALLDGMDAQLDDVRRVIGDVPVRGVLCFVNADWPLFGGDFRVRGIDVLWPRRLVKLIRAADDSGVVVDEVAAQLERAFRPA